MSAILLDGGIVHYEVIGRGRPIIFLHGWIGSWRYWVPAMQTASTGFRAYGLDMWGFGDTARDSVRYGLDKQVALLDQFLQELVEESHLSIKSITIYIMSAIAKTPHIQAICAESSRGRLHGGHPITPGAYPAMQEDNRASTPNHLIMHYAAI